jgi:hypothetical protein
MKRDDRTIKGRVAQVDICPDDAGFVISVGPVSLWLDRRSAEDLVATLGQALWVDEHIMPARRPPDEDAVPARRSRN